MEGKRVTTEIIVFSMLSVVLFNIPTLMFLFLVPIQILAVRRGRSAFAVSVAAASVVILIIQAILIRMRGEAMSSLLLPAAVLLLYGGGLAWIDFAPRGDTLRRFITAVTGGAVVIGLLAIAYSRIGGGDDLGFIDFAAWTEAQGVSVDPETVEFLSAVFREIFLSSLLLSYLFVLALNWWIGLRWGVRSMRRSVILPDSRNFRLPDRAVWFLFVPLTILLANALARRGGMEWDIGAVKYILANIALVAMALYGLQGIGIIRTLLSRWNWAPRSRPLIIALIIALLIVTGLGLIVAIIIPGLGVSELWVRYRHKESKENENHENHPV